MSKLEMIKAKLAKILCEFAVIKTDSAVLVYDGEELVAGTAVYVEDENGNRTPAEDKEYVTEDGKVITVVDGKVETILEPEDEVEPNEEMEEEKPEEEKPAEETKGEGEDAPVEEPAEEEEVKMEDAIAKLQGDVEKLYEIVSKILDEINNEKTDVEARLSKIEKMSMAQPAAEAFETTTTSKSTILSDKLSKKIAEMSKDWRSM